MGHYYNIHDMLVPWNPCVSEMCVGCTSIIITILSQMNEAYTSSENVMMCEDACIHTNFTEESTNNKEYMQLKYITIWNCHNNHLVFAV